MKSGGECSSSQPLEEVWAKLVPSDSRYSDVDLKSNEMVVRSEGKASSLEMKEWCKITRNSDLCSATMQNKSSSIVLVDGTVVDAEDTCLIKCGSEIVPGHVEDGSLSYIFRVMATDQSSTEKMKQWMLLRMVKKVPGETFKCSLSSVLSSCTICWEESFSP